MNKSNLVKSNVDHNALINLDLTPIQWAIYNLLPAGVCLLVGDAQIGKSTFALNTALAVASGKPGFDHFETNQGAVLYLSLELHETIIQDRIKALSAYFPSINDNMLQYKFDIPPGKIQDVCIQWMESCQVGLYLGHSPEPRLVIVDNLANLGLIEKHNSYMDVYNGLTPLQQFAVKNNITILCTHHANKNEKQRTFHKILGSIGMQGFIMTSILLEEQPNTPNSIIAHVKGKIVKDTSFILHKDLYLLKYQGDANEILLSQAQEEIYNYLKEMYPEQLTPKQISMNIDRKPGTVKSALYRLKERNLVSSSKGKYIAILPNA